MFALALVGVNIFEEHPLIGAEAGEAAAVDVDGADFVVPTDLALRTRCQAAVNGAVACFNAS